MLLHIWLQFFLQSSPYVPSIQAEKTDFKPYFYYILHFLVIYFNCNVRKRTFEHVRPAKIQISMRILDSEGTKFLNVDNEAFDRLRGFAGRFKSSLSAHDKRYVFSRYGSFLFTYICKVIKEILTFFSCKRSCVSEIYNRCIE